ncbi:MAG: putative phage abortive infection protein, partial [Neisseriaceae bacterium]|nr:putative phage abortive infection protein [Neisseriaceae bacterium]
ATLINFASFANSGQIGDTIGGTTAPFIGLLSAVLVYRALQAQIEANEIIQEQIEEQKTESAERQKHESFMKMYEAYMRVLGDKKLVEGVRTNIILKTMSFEELQKRQNKPLEFEQESKTLDLGKRLKNKFENRQVSEVVEKCSVEISPLMRMAYHLLKKELAQKGPQKWDNIRFFIAQLSEDELGVMAINCLYNDEGKNGLVLVAKKTGLFQHLKSEGFKESLQEQPDSKGFFNLEMTEEKYKNESVKI